MSTTTHRIPLAEAEAQAGLFMDLFAPDSFARWEIAGSIRRERPDCGDIEHVVIPRFGAATPPGEMIERPGINLVLNRLDELIADPASGLAKQIKSDGRPRWGERYRACTFRGIVHEVFLAQAENWGSILAIRTGPAEFGRLMMIRLGARGYHHIRGGLYRADGSGGTVQVNVPDEATFFRAAGMPLIDPRYRDEAARRLDTDVDNDKWDDIVVPPSGTGSGGQPMSPSSSPASGTGSGGQPVSPSGGAP